MIDKERLKSDESYREGVTDGMAHGIIETVDKIKKGIESVEDD